jgi:hypothetical protein
MVVRMHKPYTPHNQVPGGLDATCRWSRSCCFHVRRNAFAEVYPNVKQLQKPEVHRTAHKPQASRCKPSPLTRHTWCLRKLPTPGKWSG